jgi:hypothetical protein
MEYQVNFKQAQSSYLKVSKMTDFELAQIEADEMHPLYDAACEEIDTRTRSAHQASDAYVQVPA